MRAPTSLNGLTRGRRSFIAGTGRCLRFPEEPRRRSTSVAMWFNDTSYGPPISIASLTISSLGDVVASDVVGDPRAVTEDRGFALFPNVGGDQLIDPDVHEGRRPEHDVRHTTPPDRVLDVPLHAEDIHQGVGVHATERHVEEAPHLGVAG